MNELQLHIEAQTTYSELHKDRYAFKPDASELRGKSLEELNEMIAALIAYDDERW